MWYLNLKHRGTAGWQGNRMKDLTGKAFAGAGRQTRTASTCEGLRVEMIGLRTFSIQIHRFAAPFQTLCAAEILLGLQYEMAFQ
jgi:hypothetical protein